MRKAVRKGAVVGLLGGTVVVLLLFARAMTLAPPGGDGERIMWLLLYTAILGAPISLVVAPICLVLVSSGTFQWLAYVLLLISVPLNWTLLGAVIGMTGSRVLRSFGRPQSDEKESLEP